MRRGFFEELTQIKKGGLLLGFFLSYVLSRFLFAFFFPLEPTSDYFRYFSEASSLAGISGFSEMPLTSLHSVFPKLLYSIPFRFFGNSYAVIVATNVVLLTSAVLMNSISCLRIFNSKVAWIFLLRRSFGIKPFRADL